MTAKANTPLTPQTFQRYLAARLRADLDKKLVILTGPRQVGKTTLSRQLQADFAGAQYFNYDVPA
jgi:predicted AAA+ superfamily ATPase